MKRIFIFLMVLVISLGILSGCSNNSVDSSVNNTNADNTKEAFDKVYEIKLAHQSPAENDKMNYACEEFKKYVEEKTNGQVKITIYPAMQLGAEREMLEGVQMGSIEMAGLSTGPFPGIFPEIMLFDMPYLFSTREVAYEVLDGPVGQEVLDLLTEKTGIKGLAWGENGFRHFTNNTRTIRKPSDIEGLKIRVMENPAHIAMVKAMGGSPTPMAFNELYTGLQQKTVDGEENPISLISSMRYYEVQDYLTLDGHVYNPHIMIMNNDFYNELPQDIQKVIDEGVIIWKDEERKFNKTQEIEGLKLMKDFGVEVTELSTEEIQAFRDATMSVYDTVGKSQVGEELLNKALDAVEKAEGR